MTNLGHVFWENMLKNSSPQVFYERRYIIIIIIMFSSYIPCLLPRRSPVTTDSGANGGKSTSVLSTWITMDLAVIIYVCNMYIYIINIYICVYICEIHLCIFLYYICIVDTALKNKCTYVYIYMYNCSSKLYLLSTAIRIYLLSHHAYSFFRHFVEHPNMPC